MPLSRAMQTALKAITKLKPSVKESIDQQRTLEDAIGTLELGDPRCRVDRHIETLDDDTRVMLYIFTPRYLRGSRAHEPSRGTIVFIHGGGWVTGNVALYTDACKDIAERFNRRVISIDYPLSPEAKFPKALDVCYEIYKRTLAGKIIDDVDPNTTLVFGDSAGGNLTAALSTMARDKGEVEVKEQILLYPVLSNDYSATSAFPSVQENGEDYILTAKDCQEYLRLYTKNKDDLSNPYLAPILDKDFKNLPRTLIMSAEYCPLRDEDEAYGVALKDAKNDVACYRILDAIHGYLVQPLLKSLMLPTYALMANFLDGKPLRTGGKPTWLNMLDGTD